MLLRHPQIAREVLRALEARGVDAIRASLVHVAAGDQHGHPLRPELQALYALRQTDSAIVSVTRADAEQWLAWKTSRNDAWVKVGAVAAILAAIFALGAWLLPVGH